MVSMRRPALLAAGLLLLAAFLLRSATASPARAAAWTVTNTQDSGAGSLRAAVAVAQPGDTITFAPQVSGTIHLNSTLVLTHSLTIVGPGAGVLAVDGDNAMRVFEVG